MGPKSSLFYGSLYVAVIPIFACIYYLLPYHFYHATVKYEPSIEADRVYLVHGLQEALRKSVRPYSEKTRWRLDPDNSEITNLWVENGVPIVEVNALLRDEQARAQAGVRWRLQLELTRENEDKEHSRYAVIFSLVEPRVEGDIPDPSFFFAPPPFLRVGIGNPPGFIVIPGDLMDKLEAYMDALMGFPSRATGSFDRMFYLSAVTATTVGYGDIVPVTRLARLLVAFEAILEIVIVGLFLNSLAARVAK